MLDKLCPITVTASWSQPRANGESHAIVSLVLGFTQIDMLSLEDFQILEEVIELLGDCSFEAVFGMNFVALRKDQESILSSFGYSSQANKALEHIVLSELDLLTDTLFSNNIEPGYPMGKRGGVHRDYRITIGELLEIWDFYHQLWDTDLTTFPIMLIA